MSTTIDLKPGDLTSDTSASAATAFLRGAALATILGGDSGESNPLRSLPPLADAAARLHLAMGAALTFKSKTPHRLIIVYADRGELALPEWKSILRFAAAHALPILFVVQTGAEGKTAGRPGQLSLASSTCGVPGIPVDAADPVALYRVAQESTLRARAGGGPVLMECIPFQIAGKRTVPADPIDTMRQFLMHRGIASEAWFGEVEARFRARLRSASRE